MTSSSSSHSLDSSHLPRITFSDQVSTPLQLYSHKLTVHVTLPMARVTSIMTFVNHHERTLEGELVFPLPDHATLTGYALDVDGTLVDAVPIEKVKAKVVFEQEVRSRGRGAAIVEMSDQASNCFRTKVYPLHPEQPRTIRVVYTMPVDTTIGIEASTPHQRTAPREQQVEQVEQPQPPASPSQNRKASEIRLPFGIPSGVDPSMVDVTVEWHRCTSHVDANTTNTSESSLSPLSSSSPSPSPSLKLLLDDEPVDVTISSKHEDDGDAVSTTGLDEHRYQIARLDHRHFGASPSFNTLVIQSSDLLPDNVTIVEDGYFCARLKVDYPPLSLLHPPLSQQSPDARNDRSGQQPPKTVQVLWDCSLSRHSSIEKDIQLLGDILNHGMTGRDTAGIHRVIFTPFSNHVLHQYEATFDRVEPLLDHARKIPCDGATNLSVLEHASHDDASYGIVFTDGVHSLGPMLTPDAIFSVPLYIVSSSSVTSSNNSQLLSHVASKSGGTYLNSAKIGNERVVQQVGRPVLSFLVCDYESDEQFDEVYPNEPTTIDPSGYFHLYGRVKSGGELAVTFKYGPDILVTRVLQIEPSSNSGSGDSSGHGHGHAPTETSHGRPSEKLVPLLWARQKMSAMSVFPHLFHDELMELGREWSIVTPNTSLIVLESLDQYFKHQITPPASLSEMRRTYLFMVQQKETQEHARVDKKVKDMLRRWEDRKRWHQTTFYRPKEQPASTIPLKRMDTAAVSPVVRTTIPVAGPPPPPPPPPSLTCTSESPAPPPPPPALVTTATANVPPPPPPPSSGMGPPPPPPPTTLQPLPPRPRTSDLLSSIRTGVPRLRKVSDSVRNTDYSITSSGNFNNRSPSDHLFSALQARLGRRIRTQGTIDVEFNVNDNDSDDDDWNDSDDEDGRFGRREEGATRSTHSLEARGTAGDVSSINVKEWRSDADYMSSISRSEHPYDTYLQLRESYRTSPGFYLDVADYWLTKLKLTDVGLIILCNILELELDNPQLLRIVAYRLNQAKQYGLAEGLFERVKAMRPDQPQSYRDLALVKERLDKFEEAVELFNKVITGQWDERYDEIELTAIIELNHCLQQQQQGASSMELKPCHEGFRYVMDLDLRVSMAWDIDDVDIDLHVVEHTNRGDHCYFGNRRTKIGGFMSRDFRQGMGPEEYMLRQAPHGTYGVSARYFANHQQSLTGGTTVLCTFFTNYMKPNERSELVTVRLTSNQTSVPVCDIVI